MIENSTMKLKMYDSIRNAANANGSRCWYWPHLNMQLKQCLQKPSQLMVRSKPYASYGSKLDIYIL